MYVYENKTASAYIWLILTQCSSAYLLPKKLSGAPKKGFKSSFQKIQKVQKVLIAMESKNRSLFLSKFSRCSVILDYHNKKSKRPDQLEVLCCEKYFGKKKHYVIFVHDKVFLFLLGSCTFSSLFSKTFFVHPLPASSSPA